MVILTTKYVGYHPQKKKKKKKSMWVFFLISKKIILKKPHENIRQNREYREGNIKREKKRRKQEHKRSQLKTNYKEEN